MKRNDIAGASWMLVVLFAFYAFSTVDRYIITMLAPSIKTSLRLSDVEVGTLLGPAFSLFYALFGVPLGWAADRFPRRLVIFFGAIIFGVSTAMGAFVTSFGILFVTRVLVGIGEASISPAAFSLIADRFPRDRQTTASSVYNTAAKVGVASAYTFGGLILGNSVGQLINVPLVGAIEPWRAVFLLVGLPVVLFAFFAFSFREPARRESQALGSDKSVFTYMWRERRLMVPLIIGFSAIGMVSFGLSGWAPIYITRHYHWGAERYGPTLGLISLAAAGSLVVKGLIVDALYRRNMRDAHIRLYTWLLIGTFPIAIGAFFVSSPLLFLIMYGIVQVVAMPIVVYFSAATQLIAPPHLRARVVSMFLMAVAVFGSGAGPFVVGLLTDYVFGDEAKVGWSLLTLIGIFMPVGLISLRFALRPMRDAMAKADHAFAGEASAPTGGAGGKPLKA